MEYTLTPPPPRKECVWDFAQSGVTQSKNQPHHQNIFLCVHKLMDHLEDLETPESARQIELRLTH